MSGRLARWTLFALAYGAGCLMHLRFSVWLVSPRDTAFGRLALADFVPLAAAVAAIVLVAVIAIQLRRAPRPRLLVGGWIVWLAAVASCDRLLTFSANEWAHYPQYALVAWLLARAMDPARERRIAGRILLWIALLGAADELLQYLWITASYSDYYDFNDCLANVLGGSAGLLLYYGTADGRVRERRASWPRVEIGALAIVCLGVAAALSSGLVALSPPPDIRVPLGGIVDRPDGAPSLYLQRTPRHYGSWQAGPRWSRYYVLPPGMGLALVVASGAIFAGLMRLAGSGGDGQRAAGNASSAAFG